MGRTPTKETRFTEYRECSICLAPFLAYKKSNHKSCCRSIPYPKGYRFPDTKLVVMNHRSGDWGREYRVKCDCGKIIWARANNIVQGRTKSCGCGAKAYRDGPKKRVNIPYRNGTSGYFNTWQRVNILGWYFADAEGTPLLVPPEVTNLKKYKEKISK